MEIRDLAKEAIIVSEDSTFRDALSLMLQKETNSLLVVDDEGQLSGEVSVSDLLNATVPDFLDPDKVLENMSTEEGFGKAVRDAADKSVSEFMTIDVKSIHVDDSLLSIAGTAIANGAQYIPIVDEENRPIGVISRRGLKHILAKYLKIEVKV